MHLDTLQQLKTANRLRCPKFGHGGIEGWEIEKWMLGLSGEVGEMANIIKKVIRGDDIENSKELIAKEAADVATYLDMACQRLGIDLATAIIDKFNEVSERVGSEVRMFHRDIPEIYQYKDKPYRIVTESKMRVHNQNGDNWKDVVIYEALYDTESGEKIFVRDKQEFYHKFIKQ